MSPWPEIDFSDLVSDETGGNAKTLQSDYLAEGTYPIVDQGQSLIGGYSNDGSRICKAELPAIVFGDHTKCFKYIDFPFCLGADGTKILRPKRPIDERYLFYALQRIHIPDAGYSRHFKYLKEGKIPLPPMEEQKRIAAILDQADELRRKRQRALDRLNQLVQAIFIEMYGSNLRAINQLDNCLADACHKITDGTHHSPKIQDSGVPYVTAKHLRPEGLDFFSDPWFISDEDHTNIYSRCNPEKGDVLYIKDGATTGIAAINQYDFPFSMLSSLALLKVNRAVCLPEYLCAWLNNPTVKKYMTDSMSGAGITRLTLSKINSARIFIPDIRQQELFAETFRALALHRAKTIRGLTLNNEFFASLQHRAFRGELNVSSLKEAAA